MEIFAHLFQIGRKFRQFLQFKRCQYTKSTIQMSSLKAKEMEKKR